MSDRAGSLFNDRIVGKLTRTLLYAGDASPRGGFVGEEDVHGTISTLSD